MKTLSLALASLFSAPAFAGPLIVADGSTGLVALFNPRPGDPGDVVVWDGMTWTARSAARIQHQASVEDLACAITSGGALLCGYDLEDPAGTWRAIPAPGTTSFGPDTRLSVSGTGSDPLVDVLVPMGGGLAWGSWDSYYGVPYGRTAWQQVLNPSTADGLFLEDSLIATSGTAACVASRDTGGIWLSGIWLTCDWDGLRRFLPISFTTLFTTPEIMGLTSMVMTNDFMIIAWANDSDDPLIPPAGAMAYDRNTSLWVAPVGVDYVGATSDAAFYSDGVSLHRWTLGTDDIIYTLPAGQTTWFAIHGDHVYTVGQNLGTGALGDLLQVH